MNVRTLNSTKIHKDIPTSIVALLLDCGIRLVVIRDEPAPPPTVEWGVRETLDGKFITRTCLGTTTFHNEPPSDCPESIAAQLARPSEVAQAAANAGQLEEAKSQHRSHNSRIANAPRWKNPFSA